MQQHLFQKKGSLCVNHSFDLELLGLQLVCKCVEYIHACMITIWSWTNWTHSIVPSTQWPRGLFPTGPATEIKPNLNKHTAKWSPQGHSKLLHTKSFREKVLKQRSFLVHNDNRNCSSKTGWISHQSKKHTILKHFLKGILQRKLLAPRLKNLLTNHCRSLDAATPSQ